MGITRREVRCAGPHGNEQGYSCGAPFCWCDFKHFWWYVPLLMFPSLPGFAKYLTSSCQLRSPHTSVLRYCTWYVNPALPETALLQQRYIPHSFGGNAQHLYPETNTMCSLYYTDANRWWFLWNQLWNYCWPAILDRWARWETILERNCHWVFSDRQPAWGKGMFFPWPKLNFSISIL